MYRIVPTIIYILMKAYDMKKYFLYIVVSVGGAVVLALEILGTRILGPFYGVSIFLWSALITVTLAALSVGYLLGGRMADKKPVHSRLCTLMFIAGVWIIAIPWIKQPFLTLAEPLGLRFAVLSAATILFFPPLTLLGMISPYAIKLKTVDLGEVGRTAGTLYAISTLASVISALLVGFFLIPNIGVTFLTIIIGLLLLVTAVLGFLINNKSTAAITSIIILIIASLVIGWKAPIERADPANGLLAIEQSPYAELRIFDHETDRHLLIDGGIHTLADTSTGESYLHYCAVMDLPKSFFVQPGKMLLIGLGGGSMVKQYFKDRWKVDAVEIDPKVIKMAYKYFKLDPSEGKVFEMDGRQYLTSTTSTYDVILLDAYGSSSIPFHLATKEAFGLVASHLNPNGLFAINVEAIGWHDPIIATLTATLRQHFTEVLALPMEEPPNKVGNIVLLAGNRKLQPFWEPENNITLDPDWRYGPGYQKVHAWDNRFTEDITNAAILTDDLNPIDLRAEEINLATRKELHSYFEQCGMKW